MADHAERSSDLLLRHGGNDAIATATVIEQGVRRHVFAVPLSCREREAVLHVLNNAPDGLVEGGGALAQDRPDGMG